MTALYPEDMSRAGDLKVSSRGQMSLPAEARRRWGLEDGGTVGFIDLGKSVLLVPGGVQQLREELFAAITPAIWREAERGFADPDLANQ
jgi:AbrB family looped-hinge helix DNA binding protein